MPYQSKNLVIRSKKLLNPCQSKKNEKGIKGYFPGNVKTTIAYELLSQYPVKDKTKFKYLHNLVYFNRCIDVNWKDKYAGETDRKITEKR